MTSYIETERLFSKATAWNGDHPPDIVWNNVGGARPSLFLDSSIEQMRSQMDLNYWSAVYMARVTLKAWFGPAETAPSPDLKDAAKLQTAHEAKQHAPRHLIMSSSIAAFIGVAGYAPYSPAKAALRSLHDQLRSELNLYNGAIAAQRSSTGHAPPEVRIHTVFPGSISSPGLEIENSTKHPITKILEEGDGAQTEQEVARIAVAELEKGRSMIATQPFPGSVLKAGALMGSPRERWFVDSVLSWIVAVR